MGGFGEEARRHIRELPNLAASIALLRDGFHEDSPGGTVSLRDNGEPQLDYPLNDYLLDGARRSLLTQVEMQFAAGAGRCGQGIFARRSTGPGRRPGKASKPCLSSPWKWPWAAPT